MAKKTKTMAKQGVIKAARKLQILYRKCLKTKLTIKELSEMLLYLRDEYVSVSYGKGILTVETEGITQHSEPAVIIINLKTILTNKKVYIDGHIYIRTLTGSRFPHRHVFSDSSNNSLCFGNGYSACRKSIREGRLDDCVAVIQQILRT